MIVHASAIISPTMPTMSRIVPVVLMSRMPKRVPASTAYLRIAPRVMSTREVPMPMGATGVNASPLPCAGEWNLIRPAGRRVATHALCHDEPMASGGQRNGEERRARLRACRLYLVVESGAGEGVTEALVAEALAGGGDIVQVRDKNASDEEVVAATRRLREPCERHGALLVVNDRPDLTLAAGADGVHVGQEDVPVAEVR